MISFSGGERGMALAILLWLIAAMALTVGALVHYAGGDTSMAQLRLQESKAYWLGRGVVYLALRDRALAMQMPELFEDVQTDESGREENQPPNVIFERNYEIDGVGFNVALYSAVGFVSLNTATIEELTIVFNQLGGLDMNSTASVVDAVVAYRGEGLSPSEAGSSAPGFRFVEELLLQSGMTRSAYDRLKPWLHVHATGSVNPVVAPPVLASLFFDEASANNPGEPQQPKVPAGPISFNSIDRTKRRAGNSSVFIARIDSTFGSGERYTQMIHFDLSSRQLLNAGNVSRVRRGAVQ